MENNGGRDRENNVWTMGGEQSVSGDVLIRREQIAAQVVAVMRAHFSRPGPEEMREILECAEGQVTALQLSPFPLS
jgi:hypothetical protein